MLSERDRRTLRNIEQQILDEDQQFAATMSRPLTDRVYRWTRYGYDVTIALASLLAVTCLLLAPVGAGGAGVVAALFALGTCYLRVQRFPRRRR